MTDPPAPSFPPLWRVWQNPVLLRHSAARLRRLPLLGGLLVSQILAAFLWLSTFLITLNAFGSQGRPIALSPASPEFRAAFEGFGPQAALAAWIAILVLQGFLWIFKGTFSVALGVARESNEGMIDAIRLTPVPVGHKVLGQLLGLPVRETVLVLALLPWALLSVWLGGLPLLLPLTVYGLLATSTWFHHAIGLVAGTLIRQKILAGTISQVLVILLHFVLPAFGGFGFRMISHLAVEQSIRHEIVRHVPQLLLPAPAAAAADLLEPPISWFHFSLDPTLYHWLLTLGLLAFTLAILVRRWRAADSLLLGKTGSLLLAVFLLGLTCGDLLPRLAEGGIRSAMPGNFSGSPVGPQLPLVLAGWLVAVAIFLGVLNLLLVTSITPGPELRRRTKRRIARDGPRSVGYFADGRSALPHTILLSLLGAAACSLIFDAAMRAPDVAADIRPGAVGGLRLLAAFLLPALVWQTLLSTRGWRPALTAAFVIGLVPLMAAFISLLLSAQPDGFPKWLAACSGLVLPGFAIARQPGLMNGGGIGPVFELSLIVHALAFVWLGVGGRRRLDTRDPAVAVAAAVQRKKSS